MNNPDPEVSISKMIHSPDYNSYELKILTAQPIMNCCNHLQV